MGTKDGEGCFGQASRQALWVPLLVKDETFSCDSWHLNSTAKRQADDFLFLNGRKKNSPGTGWQEWRRSWSEGKGNCGFQVVITGSVKLLHHFELGLPKSRLLKLNGLFVFDF